MLMMCAVLFLSTAAKAQKKPVGPTITPALHQATLQSVKAGKQATAQNATQAAVTYNNAYNAARIGDNMLGNLQKEKQASSIRPLMVLAIT
jgi:predicted outer membrane protein